MHHNRRYTTLALACLFAATLSAEAYTTTGKSPRGTDRHTPKAKEPPPIGADVGTCPGCPPRAPSPPPPPPIAAPSPPRTPGSPIPSPPPVPDPKDPKDTTPS